VSAPRVTVLLCVYNGQAYLREAIDSILAQTYGEFELLVVDDASTDGTPAVLASIADRRLRVLQNRRNLGLTRSLNVGLRASHGELIARHDADDVSYPGRFARQVAFLDAHAEVGAVGSQFVSMSERGRRRPPHLWMKCQTALGIRWQLLFENPFAHSSVMFRRDAVLEVGGYDESFRTNQDYELWSRLARRFELRNLPEALIALRGRASSISARYSEEAIRKVGDVLIANAQSTLGLDLTQEPAIDDLLRATNPRVYPPIDTLAPVVRWIARLHRRYLELWPAARAIREIDAHAASIIARLATLSAAGSPWTMPRWYFAAAPYHLPTFVRGLPRFGVASVRGVLGRPRVAPPSEMRNLDEEAK
jgi:glycosyltransferase involved in cell wall biosynthesis